MELPLTTLFSSSDFFLMNDVEDYMKMMKLREESEKMEEKN